MIIGVILILLGIVIAVVGTMAITKKLPGNKWIGIHVPEVRKSRELWDLAHRVAGPSWLVAALAALAAGFVALAASGWMWFIVVGGTLASLVMLGIGAAMGAHTVAMYDAQLQATESDGGCGSDGGGCGCCSGGEEETAPTTVNDGSAQSPAQGSSAAGCCDSDNSCASSGSSASSASASASSSASSSLSSASSATSSDPYDPSVDCGVEGGCGSCALQGSCHPDDANHPMNDPRFAAELNKGAVQVDISAARNAAAQADQNPPQS